MWVLYISLVPVLKKKHLQYPHCRNFWHFYQNYWKASISQIHICPEILLLFHRISKFNLFLFFLFWRRACLLKPKTQTHPLQKKSKGQTPSETRTLFFSFINLFASMTPCQLLWFYLCCRMFFFFWRKKFIVTSFFRALFCCALSCRYCCWFLFINLGPFQHVRYYGCFFVCMILLNYLLHHYQKVVIF